MTKICLIGNSQVAALKLGWEIVRDDFPSVTLTVFGVPGKRIDGLRPRGSRLSPDTPELRKFFKRISGVSGRIDSNAYDRFLICTSQFNPNPLAAFMAKYRLDSEPRDERQPLSWPLFMRMAEANYRSTVTVVLAEKLRQVSDKPAGIIPAPLLSDHSEWAAANRILGSETPQRLADCFASVAGTLAESLNCQIFSQPAVTKSGPLRTKGEYSKGSIRLRSGAKGLEDNRAHGPEDISHMNAEYGAVIWRMILASPAWSGSAEMDGAQYPAAGHTSSATETGSAAG